MGCLGRSRVGRLLEVIDSTTILRSLLVLHVLLCLARFLEYGRCCILLEIHSLGAKLDLADSTGLSLAAHE